MQNDGCKLSSASKKRRLIFVISVFYGLIGFDRLFMKRFLFGAFKLALGIVGIVTFIGGYVMGTAFNSIHDFILITCFPIFAFSVWTADIVLIHSGLAKCRSHGSLEYLR